MLQAFGSFIVLLTCGIIKAAQVSRIYIKDDIVPVKLSALQLVCEVISYDGNVRIFKVDSEYIPELASTVNSCTSSRCLFNTKDGADYTIEGNTITISISSVQRTRDQKYWFCEDKFVYVQVHTVPASLTLEGDTSGGDLQNEDVTLICKSSNCVFPAPSQFQWFFKKANSQWLPYQNVTPVDSQDSCSDSEKIYSAALSMSRYTVWPLQPSNTESTVHFQCRLNFPTLQSALQSSESGNVLYAVRVTSVSLKDGNTKPSSTDTIETTAGSQIQFTCITSTSRPAATIVWYIGDSIKQRSTSTTYMYTPVYADNNKKIYCKAFNLQSENNAVSSNGPTLSVRVKVTSVSLHDGSTTPGSSSEIVVTENEDKSLTCRTGDNNPVSTITWYIGSQVKQNGTNTNFVFTPTNNDHGNKIYCTAYNIQPPAQAVESSKPKLYVRVLAGTPSLTNWTSGTPEFLTGVEVTLNCESTPTRPAVSVVWKKGTSTLSTVHNSESTNSVGLVTVTSKVTFTPQKADDGLSVSCETSIPNQNRHISQNTISVWWLPSTPFIPTNTFPWLEGQNGRQLKCESGDYGNPVSDAMWVSSVGTPATRILHLPQLEQEHDGMNVTCQLKNSYTEKLTSIVKSQIVQLDVQHKPDIFINMNGVEKYSAELNEGERLTAVCNAQGNPVPYVTWQGQATGYTQLVFTDIDRNEHGSYRCGATASSSHYPNYDFSNETTLHVTVNYVPNVTVNLNKAHPTENSSLLITCNAFGRPSMYTYTSMVQTWEEVEINKHRPGSSIIDINSVQLQDSGTYTCTVNNGIRDRNQQLDQTGSRKVLIKVSPKVLLEGTNTFAGAIGTSVNITVPFYCYPDITTVVFKHENGTQIQNSNKYEVFYYRHTVSSKFYGHSVELDGYIAVLRIMNEEVSDFANYILSLENGIGQPKELVLEHVLESAPLAPGSFSYTGKTNGVPIFSFAGGFNGGRMQTFIVETAVSGTENWKEQMRFNETDKEFLQDDQSVFRFNITGLAPNTYDIRIISENVIGRLEEIEAPALSFTIAKPAEESNKARVAPIVGGLLAAVVVIVGLVVIGIIVVRKKRLFSKDGRSTVMDGKTLEDRTVTETSYYNLTCLDNTRQYKEAVSDTTSQYETLQRNDASDPSQNYEMLGMRKETSTNSSPVAVESLVTKTGGQKIYENLKLGGNPNST